MPGRTIAIGDIHGCSAALDAMLDAIAMSLQVLPLAVEGNFNEAMKRLHTPRAK